MILTRFEALTGLLNDNYSKDMFTVMIAYRVKPWRKSRLYYYSVPRSILLDIGPKELSRRIYSVFKQHINRPAAE